ncbi:hypothetical protein Pmani_001571 [Petrolisthes manimaculis]|uniref:Uncharacterized protein n=1 Tax=Petrolisthes manimaculis TaxID=1843537 RepID=A0AAE1QJ89_9EUCA|nr:hypothetical protein Pmani_001571 [Petrolisthes manimaculis]
MGTGDTLQRKKQLWRLIRCIEEIIKMAKSLRSKQRRKNRVIRTVRYGKKEMIALKKRLTQDKVVVKDALAIVDNKAVIKREKKPVNLTKLRQELRERRRAFCVEWATRVKENFKRARVGLKPVPCKRKDMKRKFGLLHECDLKNDVKDEWEDIKDDEYPGSMEVNTEPVDSCEKDVAEQVNDCREDLEVPVGDSKKDNEIPVIDVSEETEIEKPVSTPPKKTRKHNITSVKDMIQKTGTAPVWVSRRVVHKIKKEKKMKTKKLKK